MYVRAPVGRVSADSASKYLLGICRNRLNMSSFWSTIITYISSSYGSLAYSQTNQPITFPPTFPSGSQIIADIMATVVDMDLFAPFEKDTILEVRTGRMKTMAGLTAQSGIDKQLRSGRVPVTFLGIDSDEHDLTFHGGRDKAIHGC